MQQEHKKSHRWKRRLLPSQKEPDTALTGYMRGKYAVYGDTLTPKGGESPMSFVSRTNRRTIHNVSYQKFGDAKIDASFLAEIRQRFYLISVG